MIERVNVYIDGFNFYHGMMAKGWGRYRWLDYRVLIERRIREPQVLGEIKYFTALRTHEPEKLVRQELYLRALEVQSRLTIIRGQFETRPVQCPICGARYKRPQEKRTDVNIATHLVADAFDDLFDTCFIICADTDIVPAVTFVKERFGKAVVVIDPPRRHSDELAAIADRHWHFIESHLRQSQLPDPIEYETRKGRVRRLHRPESWT